MKNQYFGDINDYKKYSLLRLLSGQGRIETAICWVLTEDDDRTDGRRIRYLEQPDRWQSYDPVLYEYLREQVLERRTRNVRAVENAGLFANFRFYSRIIQDEIGLREEFFNDFLEFARGAHLVFLDPDNGLEVKSIVRGRKASSKYIYWDEVQAIYDAGHSLLIYQHFPRRPRRPFIQGIINKIATIAPIRRLFYYCTKFVVFFLVPQREHEEFFIDSNLHVLNCWGRTISINEVELCKNRTKE